MAAPIRNSLLHELYLFREETVHDLESTAKSVPENAKKFQKQHKKIQKIDNKIVSGTEEAGSYNATGDLEAQNLMNSIRNYGVAIPAKTQFTKQERNDLVASLKAHDSAIEDEFKRSAEETKRDIEKSRQILDLIMSI